MKAESGSAAPDPAAPKEETRRILLSEEIFSGKSEVVIKHKNDFYRLMITRAGKLILNK